LDFRDIEDLEGRLPGEEGCNSDGGKGHTISHAAYLQVEKTNECVKLSSAIIFNVVCY
jgi:hypothetical protein